MDSEVKIPRSIKERISVRDYSENSLTQYRINLIKKILKKERTGPFGNQPSFALLDLRGKGQEEIQGLINYGLIVGNRYFITGMSGKDDRSLIDYGYCFEEIILELTAMGLGTCWLTGSFNRTILDAYLQPEKNSVIPAITPLGIPAEVRGRKEKLIRFLNHSEKRKKWAAILFTFSLSEKGLPVEVDSRVSPEEFKELVPLLEAVHCAPSASNRQPWRLVIQNGILHLYWHKNELYNNLNKQFNVQALDMGIALCHIQQAADYTQMSGSLTFSDPGYRRKEWIYILSYIP